jgi:hypothetical protein
MQGEEDAVDAVVEVSIASVTQIRPRCALCLRIAKYRDWGCFGAIVCGSHYSRHDWQSMQLDVIGPMPLLAFCRVTLLGQRMVVAASLHYF